MARPSDKKQLQFSDDKIEGARKMKEFADQEISSANVQMEDTSRQMMREMNVVNNPVSGTITDEKGNPLAGVTVVLSGSTMGVVSDDNGYFTLELPASEGLLTFSFVGMKYFG